MTKVEQIIMFCDIAGFMRLGEVLGERMPELVQAFYEAAGDRIVERGGRILKYIGDSILAVFPQGTEKQAVRCATEMRHAFGELLERFAVNEGAKLGVALSSGTVTRGEFGHRSLRLDDVMGETVAHASLLLRFGGIAVTERVRESLGEDFTTNELPGVPLKWKNETLHAWAVVEG